MREAKRTGSVEWHPNFVEDVRREPSLRLTRLALRNLRLQTISCPQHIILSRVTNRTTYLLLRAVRNLELRIEHENPAVRLRRGQVRFKECARRGGDKGRTISRE
jgi:hypothetical protein